MSIEQTIDKRIKEQLGELIVQNIARQARVEELTEENNALRQHIAELENPRAGEMVPGEQQMELPEMAKPNGGAH